MQTTLRLATGDDAAPVRGIYAPFVTETAITFEYAPPSVEMMRNRIETTMSQHPWLVGETASGEVVGFAYAGPLRSKGAYQWDVELTIYLADAARGGGLGRRLYEALFAVLAAQGYVWAYACLTSPHAASEAFHQALGFEHLATFPQAGYKLGLWWDVGWWRRAIIEPPAEPASPTPLAGLGASRAVEAALGRADRAG